MVAPIVGTASRTGAEPADWSRRANWATQHGVYSILYRLIRPSVRVHVVMPLSEIGILPPEAPPSGPPPCPLLST